MALTTMPAMNRVVSLISFPPISCEDECTESEDGWDPDANVDPVEACAEVSIFGLEIQRDTEDETGEGGDEQCDF